MSSAEASRVKKAGHSAEKEFAELIGGKVYSSHTGMKKDVLDKNNDFHSVKSGNKKWQIFLYGKKRFEDDDIFQVLNGFAELFLGCIYSFPESREEYLNDKRYFKEKLTKYMIALKEKLEVKIKLKAFLSMSLFNGGEVNYLTIKEHDGTFHIFKNNEVINILSDNIVAENSKARQDNQFNNQKVVFKYDDVAIGEIEMRNDSNVHYRQVKFWLGRDKTFSLLTKNINKKEEMCSRIFVYGQAIKTFTC